MRMQGMVIAGAVVKIEKWNSCYSHSNRIEKKFIYY